MSVAQMDPTGPEEKGPQNPKKCKQASSPKKGLLGLMALNELTLQNNRERIKKGFNITL